MTGKDLFREVGNINEKYITEAEETKKSIIHNVAFRRGLGTAACLVLCVGIFAITRNAEDFLFSTITNNSMNAISASNDSSAKDEMEMAEQSTANNSPEHSDWKDFVNSLGEGKKEESAAEAVDSSPQYSEQEDMMSAEPEMSEQGGIRYSYKNVVKNLQSYSNVYEELLETKAFIVVHGRVKSGNDVWQQFLKQSQDGKSSSVDLIEFTDEGDAIITSIVYDEEVYHVVMDCTRDVWGKTEIVEYEYKYLYTDTRDGYTDVILSDLKLEGEEIREAIMTDSLDVHYLVQYIEE